MSKVAVEWIEKADGQYLITTKRKVALGRVCKVYNKELYGAEVLVAAGNFVAVDFVKSSDKAKSLVEEYV